MAMPAGFEGKIAFLWKIADKLRGDFKRHENGTIMLPTLVLFRLDAVLADTKQQVVELARTLDLDSPTAEPLLKRAAGGLAFYNTSPLTLKAMLSDDKNIAAQLSSYVAGFSPEAAAVLDAFGYHTTIAKLDKAGLLYQILGDFADVDLHPNTVSNEAMGYIFEELLRKFSEMSNETAGEHYTPREVITLMVDLLLDPDSSTLAGQLPVRTVYDPAAGTGGMLTIAAQRMTALNPGAIVEVAGQEINPETWAIARSELMMRGDDPARLAPGNSLTEDAFPGQRFDYLLANPPYGVDWKKYAAPIRAEAESGAASNRFAAGLPRISDGSLLFVQHMISKFKPAVTSHSAAAGGGSRMAIVLSGSPLFSGGAGSGESEIRRWIIEGDLLEAIVALPDQMFYNTGISTYIWILTNRKTVDRAGTVTLVDAREMGSKMRKSLGDKRKELTSGAIEAIVRLYADGAEIGDDDVRGRALALGEEGTGSASRDGGVRAGTRSAAENVPAGTPSWVKVMRNQDFGFARLTVERPLRPVWSMDQALPTLTGELVNLCEPFAGRTWTTEQGARTDLFKAGLEPKQITALLKAMQTTDPDAAPAKARKKGTGGPGGLEPDAALRDQENIPLPDGYLDMSAVERILAVQLAAEKHLESEIRPYVPDAWIDHSKTKIGYEIPFTRQFYVYTPPRPVAEIRAEIYKLERRIQEWMRGLAG